MNVCRSRNNVQPKKKVFGALSSYPREFRYVNQLAIVRNSSANPFLVPVPRSRR